MDRHTILGKEKILILIFRFSVPSIVGMAVNAFYNVIDRIFVGRGVGPLALSGVAVTMPFMMILLAFALLISVGTAIRLSIKIGEKNIEEAEKLIGNAFILSIIIGLIITCIGFIFMKPILILFGGSGPSLDYAEQFMSIILFSTIFQEVGFTLNSAIRAEGNPVMALTTMLIGAILNILLNPFFIFILHLGIKGSALATLISQIVSALWTLFYFLNSNNIIRLRIRNFSLKPETITSIFPLSIGPFVYNLTTGVMFLISNQVFEKYGGNEALAVVGIISVINNLIILPVIGLGDGIQPILGYNFGAGNTGRVKETLKLSIIIATIICIIGFIPVFFFSREIMILFSKENSSIRNLGTIGLKYSMITLPLAGFMIIGISYFQAVGKYVQSLTFYISRNLIIILLLMTLSSFFGLYGGIAAFPASDIILLIATAVFIIIEWKKLFHLREKIQPQEV